MGCGIAYAQLGNQFIYRAIGVNADVVFVDAAAAKQRGGAFIAGSGIDAIHLCYLTEGKHVDQLACVGAERADLLDPGGDMPADQRPILGQLGMR